jgi:hypothetical protein
MHAHTKSLCKVEPSDLAYNLYSSGFHEHLRMGLYFFEQTSPINNQQDKI